MRKLFVILPLVFSTPIDPCLVYDLEKPCIGIPYKMALNIHEVITCESSWDSNKIGGQGEHGLLQIHPIHKPKMNSLELNFYEEKDRIIYAVFLWLAQGWIPWSCK